MGWYLSVSIDWLLVSPFSSLSPSSHSLLVLWNLICVHATSPLQVLDENFYTDFCILPHTPSSPPEHWCASSSCLNSIYVCHFCFKLYMFRAEDRISFLNSLFILLPRIVSDITPLPSLYLTPSLILYPFDHHLQTISFSFLSQWQQF